MVIIVYSQGFSLLIMPIIIMQWREEIVMFNPMHKTSFYQLKVITGSRSFFWFSFRYSFCFYSSNAICMCGDIELNPGR